MSVVCGLAQTNTHRHAHTNQETNTHSERESTIGQSHSCCFCCCCCCCCSCCCCVDRKKKGKERAQRSLRQGFNWGEERAKRKRRQRGLQQDPSRFLSATSSPQKRHTHTPNGKSLLFVCMSVSASWSCRRCGWKPTKPANQPWRLATDTTNGDGHWVMVLCSIEAAGLWWLCCVVCVCVTVCVARAFLNDMKVACVCVAGSPKFCPCRNDGDDSTWRKMDRSD